MSQRVDVLHEAAQRLLRRNAFLSLREHARAMPKLVFRGVLAVLLGFRFLTIFGLLAAWRGWFLDPRFWATGQPVHADLVTPFHHHPNLFGWRFGFQGLVTSHDITGLVLFVVCLVPLFSKKGGKIHVRFGRAFVLFWLLHLFDGLVNSAQILGARGLDPLHYLDSTGQGFSLYLYIQFAFISSVVVDFLAHGLAALQFKNHPPGRPTRTIMVFLPGTSLLLGVGMTIWGVHHLVSREPDATPLTTQFAAIYVVQVPAYIYLILKNIHYWRRPVPRAWLHGWLTEHQRNMMFCVQVTLYTGFANATMHHAPWLTPILFGGTDVGFLVWLLLKERGIRKRVVGSRLGLALVSLLSGRKRPHVQPGSGTAEQWVLDLFDVDGSGTLDAGEIKSLLESQGVALTKQELARIVAAVDSDGDGVIDRRELRTFLATSFVPDPHFEDELVLAFRKLDRDGNGHIGADELRHALGTGNDALTKTEVDALMDLVDVDESGSLDWHEFVGAMRARAA